MKPYYALLSLAVLAMAAHADEITPSGLAKHDRAETITLTFEGLQDSESVSNFYNGGSGGFGSKGGANIGVTFSPDATAFIQTLVGCTDDLGDGCAAGGTGVFGGEPSADTAMMFCDSAVSATCGLGATSETIDDATGFNTFSLYYSDPFAAGQIDIFSGLNGTGTHLATLVLTITPAYDSGNGCNVSAYGAAADPGAIACPFLPASVSFAGVGESVVFSGATDSMFIDNVSFGSATPEPATWVLVGAVLGAIMMFRRRNVSRA